MSVTKSTITKPKKTMHIVHLILTIITVGLWAPIWLIVSLINAFRTEEETITTHKVD